MKARVLATALMVVVLTSARAGGHLLSQRATPSAAAQAWAPPNTPWGDPDLQGVYSNIDELNIPLQRPAGFAGRAPQDLTADELAEFARQSNGTRQQTYEQNTFTNFTQTAVNRYDLKPSRPWLISDPPDGRIPALTAEAQRRVNARRAQRDRRQSPRSYEDLTAYERCITHGLRSMLPNVDDPLYEIVQAPGAVAITYEMIHDARIIPLDGRPHVGSTIQSYMGDARGHWDHGSLVIDTSNFRSEETIQFPLGASPELRTIERFRPVGPATVEWSLTFIDSSTWVRPWTITLHLTRTQDRPFEFACHEGNLSLRNILTAAFAADGATASEAPPTKAP